MFLCFLLLSLHMFPGMVQPDQCHLVAWWLPKKLTRYNIWQYDAMIPVKYCNLAPRHPKSWVSKGNILIFGRFRLFCAQCHLDVLNNYPSWVHGTHLLPIRLVKRICFCIILIQYTVASEKAMRPKARAEASWCMHCRSMQMMADELEMRLFDRNKCWWRFNVHRGRGRWQDMFRFQSV